MDKWEPITQPELEALIAEQLDDCPQELKELFEKYQVPLKEHKISRYGSNEKVFVVALKDNEAMYYEDVEDGFNFSPLDKNGTIIEHWCNQDELKFALLHWA
jgi:5'-deoxynucleotidase YfbR-like HD superfamily hydrolase